MVFHDLMNGCSVVASLDLQTQYQGTVATSLLNGSTNSTTFWEQVQPKIKKGCESLD